MGLRDIVGSLGVVPRYLANKDEAKSDQISALQTENDEMKRKQNAPAMKKGGMVKSSASKRADGIAKKGKTKGRMV
jgi:hypothetical protein